MWVVLSCFLHEEDSRGNKLYEYSPLPPLKMSVITAKYFVNVLRKRFMWRVKKDFELTNLLMESTSTTIPYSLGVITVQVASFIVW